MKERNTERLHPAVWPAALLMLISVGRLPELLPFLAPLQLGELAVLWAAAAFVLGPRDVGNASVFGQRLGKLLVVWFVFAVVSVLWSVWRSYSLTFLFTGMLTNLILFFVIARTTTNVRTLRFFSNVLLVAAGLLSATAVATAVSGVDQRVAVSDAYDPNDLAMVLVMMLPMAVAYLFKLRGMGRAVAATLAAAVLLGILLTGSRGGFLGLVVVGGVLCCSRLPLPEGGLAPRFQAGKFAAAALGVILLLTAVPPNVWERMASIARLEQDYNVTVSTGRLAIWSRGLDALLARPWGYGVAAFESVEGGRGGRYKAAHNIWVEMAVELGVQGLVVLALVFVAAFGVLRRVRTEPGRGPPRRSWLPTVALGLRGALIGFLVTGFFLSVTYHGVFFAILGMVAGINNLLNSRQTESVAKAEPRVVDESTRGRGRGLSEPVPAGGWRPISGQHHRRASRARRR